MLRGLSAAKLMVIGLIKLFAATAGQVNQLMNKHTIKQPIGFANLSGK